MNHIEELASHLAKTWGTKTLEEFRIEAEQQANGTVFDSLRIQGGSRLAIILCLTDQDQIAQLEKGVELVDDHAPENWNSLTLAHLAIRAVRGTGLCFESRRDEFGRREAVVLVATAPASVKMIERMLDLKVYA